ncbi:amidohydrolase family protein [Micromonospora coxensis]|uniref:amidohydrolase family protein n=1 Tax=Micromonospora coxensis TaxID=356852 RepID=UPI00341A6977
MMLVTAAVVLPGPAGESIVDGGVLVDDAHIAAVGPRATLEQIAPPGARHLDFPTATLLPGLVNGHVHLAMDASPDPLGALLRSEPATLAVDMAQRATRLLAAGVTTVRDLGDRDGLARRLRDEIDAGTRPGPRILTAGSPLTIPRGHCHFLGGAVEGVAGIRAKVAELATAGVDVIKVMAGGGHLTPGGPRMWESQFSRAELRAVVEEAGRHGLPVAAHAHGIAAITDAVAAGVDTVEHCTGMDGQGRMRRYDDLMREMAERGVAACCTTCGPDWRAVRATEGDDVARRTYERLVLLEQFGVPLITGTDAGVANASFDDLVGLLELYHWLGFPAARVVELATVASAAAIGLGAVTGRLATGYSADLLVVEGDPLVDLSALSRTRLVVARGRTYPAGDVTRPATMTSTDIKEGLR